jgi:protein SCO1/2
MRRWLEAGALLALISLAPPAAAAFDPDAALRASRAAIGRQVGDYTLRDTAGRTLRLSELRGKPLVVSFVYTGCFKVCPTATRFLAQAVKQAERDLGAGSFRVATIGFNLPYDTPQAMAEFARKQGVDSPHWLFLSPDAGSVEALAAEFGFRYERTAAGFDHLLQVSIVDADGRIYRQVYGESFDPPKFVAPLRELTQGAPQPAPAPEPAGFFDKVRLLCSVYDPATGTYRFNSAYLVEMLIGGSVILFGLATVVVEWRRKRRLPG